MSARFLRTSFSGVVTGLGLFAILGAPLHAGEVFSRPPMVGGGINASSWVVPDGSDSDMYAWEDFTLAETQTITEVRWRGGYKFNGLYPKAVDFRISFFESTANGFQPLITALPEHESQEQVIATFHTNDSAGESFAGVSGGVSMYDYHFTLPQPVTLQGGVKSWFRVVAGQPIPYPDWGMATSSFGSHFKYNQGAHMFQSWPNDLSFSLHATWVNEGSGLAGTNGVPSLSGSGSLAGGSNCAFSLTSARPSASAWLVLGLGAVEAPFKGGTLVPDPLLLLALGTSATGDLALPFVMPLGVPAGVDIVSQVWVSDPAAPVGFAGSNGLSATTP